MDLVGEARLDFPWTVRPHALVGRALRSQVRALHAYFAPTVRRRAFSADDVARAPGRQPQFLPVFPPPHFSIWMTVAMARVRARARERLTNDDVMRRAPPTHIRV